MKTPAKKHKHANQGCKQNNPKTPQHILVFQQNGSGESKIKGLRQHGGSLYSIVVFSIDDPLPPVLDDKHNFLPDDIQADLVLDFLKHPDLSNDIVAMCNARKIPIVASGKKAKNKWAHTPPT
jgi:hypothetical protein